MKAGSLTFATSSSILEQNHKRLATRFPQFSLAIPSATEPDFKMAPSPTPSALSTETCKRKQNEEFAPFAAKQGGKTGAHTVAIYDDDNSGQLDRLPTPSEIRVADGFINKVPAGPTTPDALAQQLAGLQHLSNATPAPTGQTNGNYFDRPNPLVAWKPRPKTVHALQEHYHQHQTTGRFYTQDPPIGQSRPSFFASNPNVKAQVILTMETNLGKEYHGDDRCQACIDRGIAYVRYIEGANRQIRNCGSTCARCRFHTVMRCSKKNISRKSMAVEHSDEGDEGDAGERPTLQAAEARARSAINDITDGSATPDDIRSQGEETAIQDVNETTHQPSLATLEGISGDLPDTPGQPGPQRSPVRHPVLRPEALLGELGEDDANEAQQVFDLIRRNREKGGDAGFLINHLNRLFVPVKQRVAGDRDSLSNGMARVEQEMQRVTGDRDRLSTGVAQAEQQMHLFDNVDGSAGNMEIDG